MKPFGVNSLQVFSKVGIGVEPTEQALTVAGSISATDKVYASNDNSTSWNIGGKITVSITVNQDVGSLTAGTVFNAYTPLSAILQGLLH